MVDLTTTDADGEDALVVGDPVCEHRLGVVDGTVERIVGSVRELGRRVAIDEVPSALHILLVFDNHDESVGEKDELGLALSGACRGLRATPEGVALPLRTTVLLPRADDADLAQHVTDDLVRRLLVRHVQPFVSRLPSTSNCISYMALSPARRGLGRSISTKRRIPQRSGGPPRDSGEFRSGGTGTPLRRGGVGDGVVEAQVVGPGTPVEVALGLFGPAVSQADVISGLFGVVPEGAPLTLVGVLEVGQARYIAGALCGVATGGDPCADGGPLVKPSFLAALTPACSLGEGHLIADWQVLMVESTKPRRLRTSILCPRGAVPGPRRRHRCSQPIGRQNDRCCSS